MSAIDPAKLSLVRPNDDPGVPWLGTLIGASLIGFYFWCTNQFMVKRILSDKDENHGRWGALFAGFLKLPVLFLMVLPGTSAILLYPPWIGRVSGWVRVFWFGWILVVALGLKKN